MNLLSGCILIEPASQYRYWSSTKRLQLYLKLKVNIFLVQEKTDLSEPVIDTSQRRRNSRLRLVEWNGDRSIEKMAPLDTWGGANSM